MKRVFLVLLLVLCIAVSGCISEQRPNESTLEFSSSPAGAGIYLDNQYYGTTPSTLAGVSYGDHTLEYRYQGYQNWHADITVSSPSSSYYAALTPLSSQTARPTVEVTGQVSPGQSAPASVTLQASQNVMVIGTTQVFSGTSSGTDSVILVLYGPGIYLNGVTLAQPKTGGDGLWKYTWNPGSKIQSGSYRIVAYDSKKSTSAETGFSVVGGGEVKVATSRNTLALGDTVTFSGLCTTGAKSVVLRLSGPGQYNSGIDLGVLSLEADNTWSYRYTFDLSKPLGTYTLTVHDTPQTDSDSISVTVNSPG